jgi:alpha-methylacyl-CoA racemase
VAGPLAGLRVRELAAIGPVPFAAMILADLGAEVVRVDRPDCAGSTREFADSHLVLDRGRRSISVDLKDPRGVRIVRDLAARSDVLLEGFRPGVLERLGLGPDVLLGLNPRLIVGRMTGWGQYGPEARRAGHDINYLALSGALEPIADGAGRAPTPPMNMLGDFGGGGMLLGLGVLAAAWHAQQSGQGQVVDAAIVDGAALLTAMLHSMRASGTWDSPRGENLFDGGAPYYRVYQTRDGKWFSVGAIEPKFYAELTRVLGLADELPTEAQNDRSLWPAQTALLRDTFASRTRDEWTAQFAGTDACAAPVLAADEVISDPHLSAREVYRTWHGIVQPAPAPRFSVTPANPPGPAPLVGADTTDVLAGLGIAPNEVAELVAAGVVG